MKTTTISEEVTLNKVADEVQDSKVEAVAMGMSSKGLVHLMGVLTNLYSEPATAVLREVVSNALDAHKKAKQDRPVEVTLPTSHTDGTLIVRDFGVGMDKADITETYSQYGASTKRDSNEEMGGFGLGAKSPLAITDRFDVVSVKDGVKIKFYIEKNAVGAPVLYIASEEATLESNGVTVTVPYNGNHRYKISNVETVSSVFIGAKAGALKINGVDQTVSLQDVNQFTPLSGFAGSDAEAWVSKKTFTAYENKLFVVIAGINYPIADTWQSQQGFQGQMRHFQHRVYLSVPVGSVDLTPSRENLIYSPRTSDVLTVVIKQAIKDIEANYQALLNRARNEQEAINTVLEIEAANFWNVDALRWRKKKVPTEYVVEEQAVIAEFNTHANQNKGSYMLLIQGHRRHASNLKDYIVVQKDSNSVQTYDNVGKTLRRYSRAIYEMLGYKKMLVVGKKDYNNVWYKHLHNDKFPTDTSLVEYVKAENARIRREANANKPARPRQKRALGFLFTYNSDQLVGFTVEKVYAGDARVEKLVEQDKVYYLDESSSVGSRIYPYHSLTLTGEETMATGKMNHYGTFGFAALAEKVIGGKSFFLISSRSSVEKFKKTFPNAKDIVPAVKELAQKLHNPAPVIEWNHVFNLALNLIQHEKNDYALRHRIPAVLGLFTKLKDANRLKEIVNSDFLAFEEWVDLKTGKSTTLTTAQEAEVARQADYAWWTGYSERHDSDFQRQVQAAAERFAELYGRWVLLGHVSTQENKHLFDDIILFINSKAGN